MIRLSKSIRSVFFFLMILFSFLCQNGWCETILGRVTAMDGSTGLSGICVTAYTDKCHQNEVQSVNTDGSGNYSLTIPSGFQVYVYANGDCSPTTKYDSRWYDNGTGIYNCNDAAIVSEGSTANFRLSPSGSIEGFVYESDGVTPIKDMHVYVQSDACGGIWYSGANTDAAGKYTITGIPAGIVNVRTCPECNNQDYVDEWYNGNTGTKDCNQAMDVQIVAGQVKSGIDFSLDVSGSISGTVFESDGVTPIEGMHVYATSDACGGMYYGGANTDAAGKYTITGIPAGIVNLRACPTCNNQDYVDEFYDGNKGTYDCNKAMDLQVVAEQNLPGIDFQMDAGGTIAGKVYESDGVTPIKDMHVYATSDACGGIWYGGVNTDASGNYIMRGLPVGTVNLSVCSGCNNQGGYYVNEWYNGNTGTKDCNQAMDVQVVAGQVKSGIDFSLDYNIFIDLLYTHESTGTFKMWYGVYFFGFSNFDPQSIISITMSDPSGIPLYKYTRAEGDQDDLKYIDQWKGFCIEVPGGEPALGEYTFTIEADTFNAVAKKSKLINRVMPIPDASKMLPADGAVLTSKTPIFQWGAIQNPEIPVFYRLQIYDSTGYRVFASGREPNTLSMTAPAEILKPGQTYTWRVGVYDLSDGSLCENIGSSQKFTFTMANSLAHTNVPAIDIDDWGAVAYHTSTSDGTSCWIKIIDHDGVAYNGSSHKVSVTYNGVTRPLTFQYPQSPISGAYQFWENAPAPAGDYVFTVTDPDGNTGTLTDTLVVNMLSPPDENSFSVNVDGTCPTFAWDPVTGALSYRVRIYNLDGSTVWQGYPVTTTQPSYTVPPGVLKPDTRYKYMIEAWDAHSGFDIDNVSKSPALSSNNPEFQTGQETTDPFVEINTNAVTWNNILTGLRLNFWTKIHDAQGVPSNIKSVKATFPGGTEIPLYLDYTQSPTCGIYTNDYFVPPFVSGNYTIKVEDRDGNVNAFTDVLNADPIGYPPEQSITSVFNGTQGDFTWDQVDGAGFYELEIYDMDFNRLYAFATTTNACQVPAGFLKQKTFYRYRIMARKEFFDQGVDNGSSSTSDSLMKTFVTTPDPGSATPSIDIDDKGAQVIHSWKAGTSESTFWLAFEVMVSDSDGVPDNISAVQVLYPDGKTTRDLYLDTSVAQGSTQGSYSTYETYDAAQDIQPGIYTFIVTDAAGNKATISDTLVIDPIAIPVNYIPAQGSFVGPVTPFISWNIVPDATHYRIRIYNDWDTIIHDMDNLKTNSYTVPVNLLETGRRYNYRIYAYKKPEGQDVDNLSMSQIFPSQRPHFTVDPTIADTDGDGMTDAMENSGCTDAYDLDTDDDGIPDHLEDVNQNGIVDTGETDPCNPDTDGDGIQDGTELGIDTPVADPDGAGPVLGTDTAVFKPDTDPETKTNPLSKDTDHDGVLDTTDQCPNTPPNVDDQGCAIYTKEKMDQAVADVEAAKDAIIAQKNQTITSLNTTISSMFTKAQLDAAVLAEKNKWDINGDGVVSIEEAIYALKIAAGIKPE